MGNLIDKLICSLGYVTALEFAKQKRELEKQTDLVHRYRFMFRRMQRSKNKLIVVGDNAHIHSVAFSEGEQLVVCPESNGCTVSNIFFLKGEK